MRQPPPIPDWLKRTKGEAPVRRDFSPEVRQQREAKRIAASCAKFTTRFKRRVARARRRMRKVK